jgi:hypothetical protein
VRCRERLLEILLEGLAAARDGSAEQRAVALQQPGSVRALLALLPCGLS